MSDQQKKFKNIVYVLLLCLFGQPVLANAAIPMLVYTWPPLLISLVIVIFIEAYYYKQKFTKIPYKKTLIKTAVANGVTTIIGIPIAGVILSLNPAGWVTAQTNEFMFLLFFLLEMCIFCILSWFIEYLMLKSLFAEYYNIPEIKRHTLRANLITYTLLVSFTIIPPFIIDNYIPLGKFVCREGDILTKFDGCYPADFPEKIATTKAECERFPDRELIGDKRYCALKVCPDYMIKSDCGSCVNYYENPGFMDSKLDCEKCKYREFRNGKCIVKQCPEEYPIPINGGTYCIDK